MSNTIGSILRSATRKQDDPLNILCFPTNPRYDCLLANSLPHNFYMIHTNKMKMWPVYDDMPDNLIPLEQKEDNKIILNPYMDFDAVLIQNENDQTNIGLSLAKHLQLPVINILHGPIADVAYGDLNIVTCETLKLEKKECVLITKAVDTNVFYPEGEKKDSILCVLGLKKNGENLAFAQSICKGLPHTIIHKDNPVSLAELVKLYQTHKVVLNASLNTLVPMSILEGKGCGCAVVTPHNESLKEYFKEKNTGFICNSVPTLRQKLETLLTSDTTLISECSREQSVYLHQSFTLGMWTQFDKIDSMKYNYTLHNILG